MIKVERAMLVYQSGIANVFEVTAFNLANYGRDAKRLYQGTFTSAQLICQGLAMNGTKIKTAGCNLAGDIVDQRWTEDFDSLPFNREFTILNLNCVGNVE